ncbi:MAG: PorP/SprF family type IX secretion system membrane protein [Flavobacteriales bacterium]|nr:PorP/SprF family type IX secretion system membrane protein [Flavobacteriales bacterium]
MICCFYTSVYAQQLSQSSLYMFYPQVMNPAYAGIGYTTSGMANQRFQWIGIEGRPATSVVSIGTPIRKRKSTRSNKRGPKAAKTGLGVGMTLIHEKVGSLINSTIAADISYSLEVDQFNHTLSFGLRGVGDLVSIDYSSLYVLNVNDEVRNRTYINEFLGNVGFGIFYHGEDFIVSATVPKLLNSSLDVIDNTTIGRQVDHYFLSGAYSFLLTTDFQLVPSVNLKSTVNSPFSYETNLNCVYQELFWFGLLYRHQDAIGFNFSAKIKNSISLGYSYDYATNLENAIFGSHEFLLGYNIDWLGDRFMGTKYKRSIPRF